MEQSEIKYCSIAGIAREEKVGARHQKIGGNDDDVTLAVPRHAIGRSGGGRSGDRAIGRSGDRVNYGMWPVYGNRELAGDRVNLWMPYTYG